MELLALPIEVTQGRGNVAQPAIGAQAVIIPPPLGIGVNPNPVTLANVPQLHSFRGAQWQAFRAGYAGTTAANGSWFQSMSNVHRFTSTASLAPCTFHFQFDGQAFEVLFAGQNVNATLLVDGRYASPQYISRVLRGGVQGAALNEYDTYVRFDFGQAATRRLSLYCASSLGPSALAVGPQDTLSAWDRSSEPTMVVQADSYGAAASNHWFMNAIFYDAAVRLGIFNVDVDAVGGTGYAPNNVNLREADAFPARLAVMTRQVPELFITAGGINDNNWLALAPYATGEAARLGFDAAVQRYYRDLRAALPDTVLVGLAPWHPNPGAYLQQAMDKADSIRAAMQAVAGPWVFIDNLRGGWLASSGAAQAAPGSGWQTGTGNVSTPRGDGNGDLYVSGDGTHPSLAGSEYLGTQLALALRAALATL